MSSSGSWATVTVLQCIAVCCSVLQCVAVCCSVLQCVAVCCSVTLELTLENVYQWQLGNSDEALQVQFLKSQPALEFCMNNKCIANI